MGGALRWTLLLLTLTAMSLSISVEGGDNNHVYSPCKDTTVQKHDGFTFGITFSSKNSFFLNNDAKNASLQLSPCDKRLSLSNAQLALFRPKVDEISLLTINTSSFSPIAHQIDLAFHKIEEFYEQFDSTREIWLQLEQRFSISNGSRKYRINKEIYEIKQNHTSVSEYYTRLRCCWEELEAMNELPKITATTDEITSFLQVLTKQKEEQKLFQFLNGLDEKYSSQRSQLLLMTPLPSVEAACSLIQQEESQREVFKINKLEVETTALYSRNERFKDAKTCAECGNKGHTSDKCWTVIGYPSWHPKGKKQAYKKGDRPPQNLKGKGKFAAMTEKIDNTGVGLTQQQIEQIQQLMKLLPQHLSQSTVPSIDERRVHMCIGLFSNFKVTIVLQDSYGGFMVAFAGSKYAARSPPAFVANNTHIVTSFTLVWMPSYLVYCHCLSLLQAKYSSLWKQVLEFQRGRLNNLYWKRDGCASCKGKSNFVCINNLECAIKISNCKGRGGSVDCSLGIQLAFSGTDKHYAVFNSWYEVENLRQYSLYGLYSNLRDSLTSQNETPSLQLLGELRETTVQNGDARGNEKNIHYFLNVINASLNDSKDGIGTSK
ncbi:hypothetical protein Cgig2_021856 [Carnegiea gigantea]|uniref:CCHC-type domain-containing protein n=1 Tax=Carnegiea gigantea TaxID=171969 RepID=A0A9Q1QCX5_9CARY|nr:hypothetical protein Cgig2_021856 [Carnegiea gigantea]